VSLKVPRFHLPAPSWMNDNMEGQEAAPLNLRASEFLLKACQEVSNSHGKDSIGLTMRLKQQLKTALNPASTLYSCRRRSRSDSSSNRAKAHLHRELRSPCARNVISGTSPRTSTLQIPPCPGRNRRHPPPCTAVCEECGATNHSRFGCPFANARQRQHNTRSERSAAWRGRGRGGQWRGQGQNPAPQQRRGRQETSGPLVSLANADAAYAFSRGFAGHGRRRSRSPDRG